MAVYGVDVSEADGNVNWRQMKEKGIGFAMLCAGYGSGSIDIQFRKNADACGRLGIPCGAYWTSYAYTLEMAEQEAECCMETIEEFELLLPVCVKYDHSSRRYAESKGISMTEEYAGQLAEAFCRRAEKAGYAAVRYIEWSRYENASGLQSS